MGKIQKHWKENIEFLWFLRFMINSLKANLLTGIISSPIIYIPHFHYSLVDDVLLEILMPQNGRKYLDLTIDQICEYNSGTSIIDFQSKEKDPDWRATLEGLLEAIVSGSNSDTNGCKIFIIKNIKDELKNSTIQSYLQLYAEKYEKGCYDKLMTIIIVNPSTFADIPLQLENIMTIVDLKAPTEKEIRQYVLKFPVTNAIEFEQKKENLRDDICRNLQGLQYYDVKQILNSATYRTGGFLSEKTKQLVLEEKKRVVKKSGIIEVVDTDVSFDDIGGLNVIRQELERKAVIYHHLREAQNYKISLPKGILIIGMPGCGKSMIAKAVASKFGVSLLRLDISRLMGQYVGQSEENLRKALATAEAAHPCVLWIDEFEKAFAGSTGKGNEDMLVMRLMGHFLTWMQERKTPVYIVATANDVMRPEFMRKGRFDEVYFVNFPNEDERKDIFIKKIQKYKSQSDVFCLSEIKGKEDLIVKKMEGKYGGFSGAEIESIVNIVFEKKFVEYILETEKHSTDMNYIPAARIITIADFEKEVENIKYSVMAEQVSTTTNDTDRFRQKTNIERIRDMQRMYKFTVATEGNDVPKGKD